MSKYHTRKVAPYHVMYLYHPHVFYAMYLTQEFFCLCICGQNTGARRATYDVHVLTVQS